MLGFIQTKQTIRPIDRARLRLQPTAGQTVEAKQLFGRPALFLTRPAVDNLGNRQQKRATEHTRNVLHQHGVSAIATQGPPITGITPMSSAYGYTYLAGDVGAYVAESSNATAACFFRHVGQLEERALLTLAGSYRYILLNAGRDTEAISNALLRRYGIPVVPHPTASQLKQATFALALTPPAHEAALSPHCLVYTPTGGIQTHGGRAIKALGLHIPEALATQVPSGFSKMPVLSEAAFRGQIDISGIKIHSISIDKGIESEYNANLYMHSGAKSMTE